MSRRLYVAVALVALATPLTVAAAEPVRLPLRDSLAMMAPRFDLTQLFARLAEGAATVDTGDGVNSRTISVELVVARLGADGKPVMACVDNAEAAERFFEAPVARIGRGKAQDQ